MLKLRLLLMLAIAMALPIIAARFLPWWGTILVIGGVMALVLTIAPTMIGEILQDHMIRLFREKARVLANAAAEIREVIPVDRPTGVERTEGVRYVKVDVLIRPEVAGMYDPADLALVPEQSQVDAEEMDRSVAHSVKVTRVEEDGSEHPCEQLSGEQRLRITFQVPDELRGAVKFRYYYSDFGRLEFG